MKRKHKYREKTRTLGDLKVHKKVEVKPHSRRTRSGKRIIVKGYERGAGGRISHAQEVAQKSGSGTEFERIKEKLTPYGDRAKKGLKTFQANVEDILSQYKDAIVTGVKNVNKRAAAFRKSRKKQGHDDGKPKYNDKRDTMDAMSAYILRQKLGDGRNYYRTNSLR